MATLSDRFDLFVFDLDGTLADTRADIASSVNHALALFGLPALSIETVTRYVGDGARKLIERSLGPRASAADLDRALDGFLEHYRDGCTRQSVLYPGVAEALARLASHDLAVLTNKPLFHSRRILRALDIDGAFRQVVGGDGPWPKKPDPAGLLAIIASFSASPARTLFIGDSAVDVQTGRAAGTGVGFVLYGFRPDALAENPADFQLGSLVELLAPRP